MRDAISQYILIPVGKTFSKRNYLRAKQYQKFLETSERGPIENIKNFQNERINLMISHAYKNVPYYRNLFNENKITPSDIQCKEDLSKIPFLTKDLLVRNRESLVAENAKRDEMRLISTGGTTGTPISFYRDWSSEYLVDGNNWRFFNYCGYQVGMKLSKLWGNESDLLNSYNLYGKLKGVMDNEVVLNFYDLSEASLSKYVNIIREKKPKFWKGFSSAVYTFVRYIRRNGHNIPKPKAVIITSDKIDENQREYLDDYFDGAVYNEYGCREFSILGFECDKHNGIHIGMENVTIEIDPDKKDENGYGDVVITSLINWGMPFIRYRLGDSSRFILGDCACGRSLPRLESIRGRKSEFVITNEGKLIYGDFFAHLFYGSKGVEHYQVVQKEVGKVEIYIEPNEFYAEEEIINFIKTLKEMTNDNLIAEVIKTEKIESHRSGKRRSVVSYISDDFMKEKF